MIFLTITNNFTKRYRYYVSISRCIKKRHYRDNINDILNFIVVGFVAFNVSSFVVLYNGFNTNEFLAGWVVFSTQLSGDFNSNGGVLCISSSAIFDSFKICRYFDFFLI